MSLGQADKCTHGIGTYLWQMKTRKTTEDIVEDLQAMGVTYSGQGELQ